MGGGVAARREVAVDVATGNGQAAVALAPHFDGTCAQVAGLVGTEDLTIHPRTGVAYLSSCDFRSVLAGRAAKCSLYAYDLNAPSPRPVDLVPDAEVLPEFLAAAPSHDVPSVRAALEPRALRPLPHSLG